MKISLPSLLFALPVALFAAGCGDDPAAPGLSTCATIGPVSVILDNHLPSGGDHELVVPPEDVVTGLEKTYDIRGDNVGHTHSVTITGLDFTELQAGDPITVISSNNGPVGTGHDHTVQLSCPA